MATTAPIAPAKSGFKFTTVKHITLPLLKFPDNGSPIYVKFDAPIFKASKIEGQPATAENNMKEPPELAHVTNLETGELAQLIMNKVLAGELRKTYEEDAYVGKSFMLVKHKISGGKRYATFDIAEIEVSKEDAPEATAPVKAHTGKK